MRRRSGKPADAVDAARGRREDVHGVRRRAGRQRTACDDEAAADGGFQATIVSSQRVPVYPPTM